MLVYDRGEFWFSSMWVSEEIHMVHTIDQFDSREIERSEEYQKELIFPAYELHLCNCCEGYVQVYKGKFKVFKQAGRLQGVDVVMCLKRLIRILKIEEGKLNSLSIKVMKFTLLVIDGKYSERETASSLLFGYTEISSMESIASSFVILLENAIANVIVKLIVESNCIMLPNDVYPWSENEEISPYPTMWNSLINKFAQQGMCVEVLKYFRSMRLVVHICSRILMSWFKACVDPLVWPNGKEMNGCSLRFLVDRNHLLSTALIELLRQFLNNVMGTLEGMKTGIIFRMKLLHAIILNRPWCQ
jgi:pentatricopeptide repeat protein